MAQRLGVEPFRLALGWGDWNLVGTCRRGDLDALRRAVESEGSTLHELGQVEDGVGVELHHQGVEGPLLPLDSQRFTSGSWFTAGLEGYIDTLMLSPLHASR